jgi:hypothetical protein
VSWPNARIRREVRTERGDVTRFVMQLEYDVNATLDRRRDSDWRVVARFDHDSDEGQGHDVTEEGLHMDVYRNGEKYRRAWDFPEIDLNDAPGYCREYLCRHSDWLLSRFEKWHGLRRTTD